MNAIEQGSPPPAAIPGAGPERVLGGFDAACVVVGAIIGVGIFFTPTDVVRVTHTTQLALIAWAVAGAIALCGALTFAALGRQYHASGAQYEILRDAYTPLPAFVFVFCNATVIQPGAIAIISTICARHLGVAATGDEPQGVTLLALSTLLIAGLVAANLVGVRWGARIQNLTVLAKVLILLAITGAAALFAPPGVSQGTMPEPEAPMNEATMAIVGVLAALVPAFFSYGGWQHALWISGEVRNPRRNLPRAIIGGVLLVIAVYLLANWAYLRLLGPESVAQSGALAADAARVVMPGAGARVVAGAVAISAFGVLNAQFLSGPRLLYGMAADGRFFAPFARLHRRFGTPAPAILMLGGFALALLLISGYDQRAVGRLLTGVVAVDSVFFGLTGAAIFVLARRSGGRASPLARLGYPLVPLCFVLGELGVVAGSFLESETRHAAALGAAWIVLGTVLYVVRFRGEGERAA